MIPDDAEIAYEGKKFRIYRWEQDLYDGTKDVFEAVERKPSVQIIPVHNEKILVTKEEQPHRGTFTGLVGGMGGFDEKPRKAAKRELLEETGYEAKDWEKLEKVELREGIHWDITYYIARDLEKRQEPNLDPGEKIQVKQLPYETFLRFTQQDDFRSKYLQQKIGSMNEEDKNLFKKRIFKE